MSRESHEVTVADRTVSTMQVEFDISDAHIAWVRENGSFTSQTQIAHKLGLTPWYVKVLLDCIQKENAPQVETDKSNTRKPKALLSGLDMSSRLANALISVRWANPRTEITTKKTKNRPLRENMTLSISSAAFG